ncbi:hypothetical protein Y032_0060g3144 [Ancylostoma ceylanicum]|uniref:Uncharacterized protein n=2 Tax=Ancylostoma ceylanicum TaxID=53326 RepID=A0A016U308_9BILA|nr:hypothetical protein Y032_0060g3144 [Ancylostoma ceylanicum]
MILLPVVVVTTLLCYAAVAQQNPQQTPAAGAVAPKAGMPGTPPGTIGGGVAQSAPGTPTQTVVNQYTGRGEGTGDKGIGDKEVGDHQETGEEDTPRKKKNGMDRRVEAKVAEEEEVAGEREEDVREDEGEKERTDDQAEVAAVIVEIGMEIEVVVDGAGAADPASKMKTTITNMKMTTTDDIRMEIGRGGVDIIIIDTEIGMDNVVSNLEYPHKY